MSKKATKTNKDSGSKITITQSLIKSLRDYMDGKGECGLQLESKFIKKEWDKYKPSDVMLLGTWFEYKLTGTIPKSGIIPEPVRIKDGSLSAPYKRMEIHVANFKKIKADLGFKILEVDSTWKWEDLSGTLDLFCKATKDISENGRLIVKKGGKFIVDIKSSGLLDDKWNPYGWDLNNLGNKDKLITQPIHYKYLGNKIHGEYFPFLFILFHSNNEHDFRMINFEVEEGVYDEHEEWIKWTRTWMEYFVKKGFTSYREDGGVITYPSVAKCSDCPIQTGCKDFRSIPDIKTFDHALENIDSNYNN